VNLLEQRLATLSTRRATRALPARDGARQLDDGALWDSLTGSQQNPKTNVNIDRRATSTGNEFSDHIDDERIARLMQDQIQTDM
jgi:hypothetical protein